VATADRPEATAGEEIMSAAASVAGTEPAPGIPTRAIAGPRASLAFNHPRHRNRLEPADLVAIMRRCDAVDADPALRVLVLTGTGPVCMPARSAAPWPRARRRRWNSATR
jgi:hypothetical protein